MRKIIALLLLLTMMTGLVPALADEGEDAALVRAAAETALAELLQEDIGGWSQLILANAKITDVALQQKYYKVTVEVPTLKSGASGSWSDGVYEYLQRAFAPYLTCEPTKELTLTALVKEADGAKTVTWVNDKPQNLLNRVNSLANAAKQSYTTNNVRIALDKYLLPEAVEMPKSKPKENFPAIGTLPEYTSAVAAELGLSPEQAAQRLPALMMLMDITSFTAEDTLDAGVVTVTVKDWKTMLQNAANYAKDAMTGMVGVPKMSRLEIASILCSYLPQALVDVYYSQKGKTTEKLTVDLASAVEDGVQAADGLMDYFRVYNNEVDRLTATLGLYASTLAYYPRVELIDTCILAGAEHEGGTSVSFDMGDNQVNHGYICIMQGDAIVLEGFVHNGVRLLIRLNPGEYKVYCSIGPEWFGEKYFCGRDAYYGAFDLTVEKGSKAMIHMEDVGGNLPVQDMTEAEFHVALRK